MTIILALQPGYCRTAPPEFHVCIEAILRGDEPDSISLEKLREDCPTGAPIDLYADFFFKHLGVKDAKNAKKPSPAKAE